MKKTKQRGRSLIVRVISLLLAIMLPILALQIYNYTWNTDIVSEELTSAAASNVRYLKEAFQTEIDSLIYQQELLLRGEDVGRYLAYGELMTPSQRYTMTSAILKQINLICHNHSLIQTFSLYFPTLNVCISKGYRGDTLERFEIVQPIPDTEVFANANSANFPALVYENDRYYIQTARRLSNHTPYLFSKAVLSTDSIADMLRAYDTASNQKVFLLHWSSGSSVASNISCQPLGRELLSSLNNKENDNVYRSSFDDHGKLYIAFCADLPALGVSIVQLVDEQVLNAIPARLRLLIFVMIALVIGLSAIYYIQMQRLVNQPVQKLMRCFQAAGEGDLSVHMKDYHITEFRSLSASFNTMIEKIRNLVHINYQQTILLQRAQLRQLRSQIEPHFLYNTFFMLRHTIDADEIDKADKICDYLGHYFQFITKEAGEFIDLESEYGHTMNYVSIQEMRFNKRLTMDIQPLPPELMQITVPVLILQPLIENAIEHGIPKENAVIRMRFAEESSDSLLIYVEDNGDGLTDEKLSAMGMDNLNAEKAYGIHALENIHSRLHLHYGEQYGLRFKRSDLGGLCVEMRIKLSRQADMQERSIKNVLQHPDC